jgi:hypothetical protein
MEAGMRTMLLVAALTGWASAATTAAPASDPDWPCVQRLVPNLTVGTYWTAVPVPRDADWRTNPAVAALVGRVAPRSVLTEQGVAALDAFAAGLPLDARAALLAETFAGLVDETNRQRGDVIERIKELTRRQRALGNLVAQISDELRAVPAEGADAARRDEIVQRRALVIRGIEQTQQTMRYACDVPVQLEARLGAFARALQGKL